MTKQFQKYSKFYDLIYNSKDYLAEANYVGKLLHSNTSKPLNTLLSLGCGTATYELLLVKNGFQVDGVDLSVTMLAIAKEKISKAKLEEKITLHHADIRKLTLNKQFDTAIMLFNIMGYMITNIDLESCLLKVSEHLKPGGLFVFDCWYAPFILNNYPTYQIKEITQNDTRIVRLTHSQISLEKNLVNVNFKVLEIKKSRIIDEIEEDHSVRYFSLPELGYYFSKTGFQLVAAYDWLETTPATGKKRDIVLIIRKD